ncbi:hypothetical protein [Polyangium sp. 15x6]|uniref:hypothetical protein n=1 Tax=Polyangium sp. 15x6 TaxID=3042687 RepID=UPI00249CD144|nr:hypothetical protein [Polyangium sp. 15x6]MDI3286386.1 hypothetical protein [Polyangium sp. 15x6]
MRFSNVAASLAAFGLLSLGVFGSGCGGEDTPPSQPPPSGANCALTAECVTTDPTCIALVDNAGQTEFGLRMSQIIISKPATLAAASFIGKTVASGVALKDLKCNLDGSGTFSWLLHFDTTTNTVCTGGAKPVASPADGYTFVNEMVGGFNITPIKFTSDLSQGSFEVMEGQDIIVPVYTAEGGEPILLPLKKARILDGKLSSNNNCVGSYNAEGLDPLNLCKPYPEENQFTFNNAGKIEGYITLEDADAVEVDLAKKSLCALLTGKDDGATPIAKCARDANGKIDYKGDWCDATNAAADGTCADAVQLGAEFAASAVKINGGCPL